MMQEGGDGKAFILDSSKNTGLMVYYIDPDRIGSKATFVYW
jgi:hypothetical protein